MRHSLFTSGLCRRVASTEQYFSSLNSTACSTARGSRLSPSRMCLITIEVNGLGLSTEDALTNVTAFRGRMRLLEDGESVWDRLRALVAAHECRGKQIHDANVVACALTSGVTKLVTANVGDFRRFAAELELIDLAEI